MRNNLKLASSCQSPCPPPRPVSPPCPVSPPHPVSSLPAPAPRLATGLRPRYAPPRLLISACHPISPPHLVSPLQLHSRLYS